MANEVVIYGAANHASNDLDLQGGGIDLSTIIITSNLDSAMPVSLVSSSGADTTQIYRIEGVNEFGLPVSEDITINGSTEVETEQFIVPFRIDKIGGGALAGTVSIFQVEVVATIPGAGDAPTGVEVTTALRLFHRITTSASVDVEFYEKIFYRNNTGSSAITDVRIDERFDPLDSVVFALDNTINGSTIIFNRTIKPSSALVSAFDSSTKSTSDLDPGDAIGVWVRLSRPAGDPRRYVPWKLRLQGTADSIELAEELISVDPAPDSGETILFKRNRFEIGGGNPQRYMELAGAAQVPMSFNEPDPRTFRSQFYYNTRMNRLYKKLNTKPWPVWKLVR